MRLLICAQAVDLDDPVLGFFHRWLEEFSKHCEHISVVCLKEGRHALPQNVSVYSLGKESGRSRFKYLARFYRYIWSLRGEYDAVFVHMNEEYALLGGIPWRIWGKKVALWRNHKKGSWRTRLAVFLATRIYYTSSEAFVARAKTAVQMPIGIDTDAFSPGESPDPYSILFLGRLDAVKNPDVFLEAMQILAHTYPDAHADIYGDPTPGREAYANELKARFASLPNVTFHGSVSHEVTSILYRTHAMYVNLTPSGSFDKTIGEALAAGCVVVASNDAVASVLGEFLCKTGDAKEVAETLAKALAMSEMERRSFSEKGRDYVVQSHGLALLAERVCARL